MEVKVVLKSPAPNKSKEPVAAKALNSKLRRAPTANHDSDSKVTKEPQHKRKATEMQSTAAHAEPSHEKITDEEQRQEQPRKACLKMRPPPAPESTVDPNPAPKPTELEDRQVTVDERPKKKARLERESAFKSAPKSPGASAPKSSREETASEPTAINGNRVVRTTKMMISVPNTRNLRPRK